MCRVRGEVVEKGADPVDVVELVANGQLYLIAFFEELLQRAPVIAIDKLADLVTELDLTHILKSQCPKVSIMAV